MHEDDTAASLAQFYELINHDDGFNISLYVLELIRDLRITSHNQQHKVPGGQNHELCLRVIKWLVAERMMSIAGDTVQLTDAGHRSITAAASADRQLSDYLARTAPDPNVAEANTMVLALLKAHFERGRGCQS